MNQQDSGLDNETVFGGTPDDIDPQRRDWIVAAADGIRSTWIQWEQEAGEISTREQDSQAGEEYLHRCLVNYLRLMQQRYSRLVSAAQIALESEEFRQGKRKRGWDRKFMEDELRTALAEAATGCRDWSAAE